MNIGTGCLMFVGFILLVVGILSKLMGMSLFKPFFSYTISYFIAANTCFLLALIVDKFHKE